MKNTDYAYSVSYIRAIENKLLSAADIESLITAQSFAEAARILSDRGYSDTPVTEENLSSVLDKQMQKAWEEVLWTLPEQNIFEIFIFKNDFHNLKAVLKAVFSGHKQPERFVTEPATVDFNIITKAMAENDFSLLPEMLRKPAQNAYDILKRTSDGQLLESVIDKARMDYILQYAQSTKNEFLIGLVRLENTMTDIKIAQRCSKTGKDKEFMKISLSEGSYINRDLIIKAALEGSVCEYLKESGFSSASDALGRGYSEFEKYSDNLILEYMKNSKFVNLGIEPLIAYIYNKQNEVLTVRVIMAAKLNNIEEAVIRNKIRGV